MLRDQFLHVRIDELEMRRLRRYAELHDRPVAVAVRRALRQLLESELPPEVEAERADPQP